MEPNWQTNRNFNQDGRTRQPPCAQGYQGWQGYPPQPQGAAPTPSNPWTEPSADPFDEPAEAPELRSQRSDHLYNREDRFWQQVPGGSAPRQPRRAEGHTLRWVVLILAVLVAAGVLVYGAVFQVREISVQGNVSLTARQVIDLSGISLGMNTFAIDDDRVEAGIESNRYLSFVCVDKQLPDKVVIQVKERVPAAAVKYCGILYTMDNRGMVLEESLDTEAETNLLLVSGLNIHNCRVGAALDLNNTAQLLTMTEIMIELKVMSGLQQMKELDLSNMDNLFMVSRDGFTVRLGPADSLHARLRAMLLTMDKLRQDGYSGGTVDVSVPKTPTYIPES